MVKINKIIKWQQDNIFNFIDFMNIGLLIGFLGALWLSYPILEAMVLNLPMLFATTAQAGLELFLISIGIVVAGALIGSYIRKGSFELFDEAVFLIGIEKFIKFLAVIFLIQLINFEPLMRFFTIGSLTTLQQLEYFLPLELWRAIISTGLYLIWWYFMDKVRKSHYSFNYRIKVI